MRVVESLHVLGDYWHAERAVRTEIGRLVHRAKDCGDGAAALELAERFASLADRLAAPSADAPRLVAAVPSGPVADMLSGPVAAVLSGPVADVLSGPVAAVPPRLVLAVASKPASAVPPRLVSAVASGPVSAVPPRLVSAAASKPVSAVNGHRPTVGSLLAAALAAAGAGQYRPHLLTRRRAAPKLRDVDPDLRPAVVAGLGFEVCEPVAGCHVVLVDDVILTGATLGMVAACLQEAGAASVTAAVAARTRRP